MATVAGSGTTLADGTEQIIFSSTSLASYQPHLRLNNMQAGDTLVVRVYTKVGASGTMRVVYTATFNDAQTSPDLLQVAPPIPSAREYRVTIQQTAGTNRNYDWRIDALGAVTVVASGTLASVVASEEQIARVQANGSYVLLIDLANMTGTDQLTLRAKQAVLSGGTRNTAYDYTPAAAGAQSDPDVLMISLPISSPYDAEWTLEQTAGSARNYPYDVVKVAA